MRRLALHTSALSDVEYDLYTSSLKDLALSDEEQRDGSTDDDQLEHLTISVREARAWLKGRYSHVSAPIIDGILRLFSPNLAHGDSMSGSEFFAALRLVTHAENGREVDRSLAFIQATPSGVIPAFVPTQAPHTDRPTPSASQTSSPAKRPVELPPPMPTRRVHTDISLPPTPSSSKSPPDPQPRNPFAMSDAQAPRQPPLHPSRSESVRSMTNSVSQHSSHNPFVQNITSVDESSSKRPPVLPPRKTAPLVPPRITSSRDNRASRSISPQKPFPSHGPPISEQPKQLPPAVPPKLPHHVTSNLMKQSLQASKVAQSMKKAEEQLEKERVLQVLKSSSVVTGSYSLAGARLSSSSVVIGTNIHNQHQHHQPQSQPHPHQPRDVSPPRRAYAASSASSASASDGAPPLPRRRQHPSPPLSASSLEQVALAAPPPLPPHRTYGRANSNPGRSPFQSASESPQSLSPNDSPTRPNVDLPAGPPPTHPDRKHHFPYNPPPSSQQQRGDNLESFEAIYGPMSSTPSTPLPPSPLNRVFRSKSMHQTSPPIPPLPPPSRRKRPESVQVLSSGEVLSGSLTRADGPTSPGLSKTTSTLSRHTSLSTPHRRSSLSITSTSSPHSQSHSSSNSYSNPGYDASPLSMSHIQRTIATLQPKLESLNTSIQPHIDKARYKAEAGLSRRGFVRDRTGKTKAGLEGEEEEGLMRGDRGYDPSSSRGRRSRSGGPGRDSPEVDYDSNSNSDVDDDHDGMGGWRRGRGMGTDSPLRVRSTGSDEGVNVFGTPDGPRSPAVGGGGAGGVVPERDNLKWPAGEGWKPL